MSIFFKLDFFFLIYLFYFWLHWVFVRAFWRAFSRLRGMWNVPRPGDKPVSPELAGGFLSCVPPQKSSCQLLYSICYSTLLKVQGKCLGTQRYILGNRKKIIGTLWYSNKTWQVIDSLLNINYNATSISFLNYYIKIHWFILHFETLNHGWFYIIIHWSLGKQGSTKSGTSSVPDLIIKTTNYWESQSHRHKFSKTVTLARKLNSYHWQQILTVVFLEATLYLYSLSRKIFNIYSRSLNAIARHPFHLNLFNPLYTF